MKKSIEITHSCRHNTAFFLVSDQFTTINEYLVAHGLDPLNKSSKYEVWLDAINLEDYELQPITGMWISDCCNKDIFDDFGETAPDFHITHIRKM